MIDIEHVLKELTLEEKAGLCSGADFKTTKPVERLKIPKLVVCDGPNGVCREFPEVTCFPSCATSSCSFDEELIKEMGKAIGEECHFQSIDILLGPGATIKRTPLCGRNFEYYSEDPLLSSHMARGFINGVQSQGIGTCVKHYACNNQEANRLFINSVVDERTLHEIYLTSFEAAVRDAQPYSMMASYNQVNGEFVTGHKYLLTDVLRGMWNFEGIVISDWGATDDRVKDLKAGMELEMPSSSGVNDALIVAAVRNGTLDENILNTAIRRYLNICNKCISSRNHHEEKYDVKEHRAIAKKVADNSIVLLKNDKNVLPLRKEQKVCFISPYAKNPRYKATGSSYIPNMEDTNMVDSVARITSNVTYAPGIIADDEKLTYDEKLFKEALDIARNSEVAVVFASCPMFDESEGFDRPSIDLPPLMNKLIDEVASVNENTVVVLETSSAVCMPWVNKVRSILSTFLAGQCVGDSVVDILYGIVNPSGKLSETFPIKIEDTPSFLNYPGNNCDVEYREGVFVGYRYYATKKIPVLFPFGHGLSYTTFEYSNIRVSKDRCVDTEIESGKLTVTVTVKNTGNVAGKEVVQLYVRDVESTNARPAIELKDFKKVTLEKGAETDVTFTLNKRSFSYWDTRIHNWHIESGTFTLFVGSSSEDLRLNKQIYVESTEKIFEKVTFDTPLFKFWEYKGSEKYADLIKPVLPDPPLDPTAKGAQKMFAELRRTSPIRVAVPYSGGSISYDKLREIIDDVNSQIPQK